MSRKHIGGASVSDSRSFFSGSSGRWAGEQLLRAMQEGRSMATDALRTLDTLRKDEWKTFDEILIEEATIRLRGVADLMRAGLTRSVANGLGKTVYEYEKVTDLDVATTSMDGITRTEGDRQEFELAQLPLPITHKDFYINLRTLSASRERGESLDTTQVRTAGRVVAEQVEKMLFQGGRTFGALPIYGYTTHPDRSTTAHGTNGLWTGASKTGENMLNDVLTMKGLLEADRMYGPYVLYLPGNYSTQIDEDFKANSDKTIRQRLLEVDGITAVTVCDQLTDSNVVMVQMTPDVVVMVEGEPLQTIQWDVEGGFQINFKAMTIQVPLIRSDADARCGVCHMSGT